jgi:hypothetical protein
MTGRRPGRPQGRGSRPPRRRPAPPTAARFSALAVVVEGGLLGLVVRVVNTCSCSSPPLQPPTTIAATTAIAPRVRATVTTPILAQPVRQRRRSYSTVFMNAGQVVVRPTRRQTSKRRSMPAVDEIPGRPLLPRNVETEAAQRPSRSSLGSCRCRVLAEARQSRPPLPTFLRFAGRRV